MDLKAELNYFKIIDLEEIVKGDEKIPDNMRNSIFLYNKAIESLKSGSEDIAIIELKKAVAMNPHFNEALNLLGVCYSYTGDKEKAVDAFEKVVKSESNSVYAMRFMQRYGLGEPQPVPPKTKQAGKMQQEPKPGEPLKRIRSTKPDKTDKVSLSRSKRTLFGALMAAAGLAVGLFVAWMIWLSLPEPEPVQLPPKQEEIDAAVNAAKTEFDKKYAELEGKYETAQKDRETAIRQADYYKAAIKLYEVESMVNGKKYESAADMLMLMKTVEFRNEEKEKFDSLYEKVMPLAAKSAYDNGYKLYNSKKYQDSLKSFEKVKIYDPTYSKMDAALYYMGRCQQILHDSRSAIAIFQELVDGYPESWYTRNAKVRLNELTKVP